MTSLLVGLIISMTTLLHLVVQYFFYSGVHSPYMVWAVEGGLQLALVSALSMLIAEVWSH